MIVGGGIIGLSAAWYLTRRGHQITVLDRANIGEACSGGNCGLVCPSHVLPLTEPGALKAAFGALLTRNSPFRIKPSLDSQLWSWLWHFARRCNHDAMFQAAYAIQAMLTSAMNEYRVLVQQEGIECEWQAKGLLFTYLNRKPLDEFQKTNELLTEHFNEPARKLGVEESIELEPALKTNIAGSWFYEHDAHLRPDVLIASLRLRLEKLGTQFIEQTQFLDFEGSDGSVTSAQTDQGPLAGEQFIVACGALTPKLKRTLGCAIPIQPGKGYSITMPRPARCPAIPIIFPEHRVAVTPMLSGYRLGSIMEFAGYDDSIKPERLRLLRDGAAHYLHEPLCEPELSTWFGWRPMTYDSIPIVDFSPKWRNVLVATGHNMLGLSMAPATGRLASELLDQDVPHIDPAPYRLTRF